MNRLAYRSGEFHPRDHPEYRSRRPLRYADFDRGAPPPDLTKPLSRHEAASAPPKRKAASSYKGATGVLAYIIVWWNGARFPDREAARSQFAQGARFGPRHPSGGSALGVPLMDRPSAQQREYCRNPRAELPALCHQVTSR
jgi:hypothetical protein